MDIAIRSSWIAYTSGDPLPSVSHPTGRPLFIQGHVKTSSLFSAAHAWLFSHRSYLSVKPLRGLRRNGGLRPLSASLGGGHGMGGHQVLSHESAKTRWHVGKFQAGSRKAWSFTNQRMRCVVTLSQAVASLPSHHLLKGSHCPPAAPPPSLPPSQSCCAFRADNGCEAPEGLLCNAD